MGPTGNLQGSVKFMHVTTGNKIVQCSYTRLPMPDLIIKSIEKLAERDKANNRINFQNQYREHFDWDNEEYNTNLIEQEHKTAPYPDVTADLTGIELDQD